MYSKNNLLVNTFSIFPVVFFDVLNLRTGDFSVILNYVVLELVQNRCK